MEPARNWPSGASQGSGRRRAAAPRCAGSVGGRVMVSGARGRGEARAGCSSTSRARADLIVVGSAGHLGLAGLLSGQRQPSLPAPDRLPARRHSAQSPVRTPTDRLVLSPTLDPDGETYEWVAPSGCAIGDPVHVIASYDLSPRCCPSSVADAPRRSTPRSADRTNGGSGRCGPSSRNAGSARSTEVVEGPDPGGPAGSRAARATCSSYPRDASTTSVRRGDCPIAVVPTPHQAPGARPRSQRRPIASRWRPRLARYVDGVSPARGRTTTRTCRTTCGGGPPPTT